jgi:hypothetical protein
MRSREEKHLNNERLCYACDTLQKSKNDIRTYSISYRGYGSIFDNCRFSIQLCSECDKPEYNEWFNERPKKGEYWEEYEHEEKIRDLINSFIIENQEYVWNGMDGWGMERQDWIDMKKGILPDEKYEEYGMYSPRQINAYKERFPTCEHPVNIVYEDGSKGCWCPFGAHGYYDQEVSPNISDECYGCNHYKVREAPIKEMDNETYNKYKKYIKAKLHIELYKDLFE